MEYADILKRLEGVRPKPSGDAWYARCPVHGDRRPSLFVWVGKRGDLCARCLANKGCRFLAIVQALGTEIGDWCREKRERRSRVMSQQKVTAYDYRGEDGKLLFQTVRYEPGFDGERKTFRQRRLDGNGGWINSLYDGKGELAVELVPYRLPELLAEPEQPVLIVEGEKDVESLRPLGLVATTNPMGAGKWRHEYGRWLRGRRVAILPDNDEAGESHAWQVAGNLLFWGAQSVRIVRLVGLPPKGDVTDWLHDRPAPLPAKPVEEKRRGLLTQIRLTPEYVRTVRAAA